MTAPLLLADDVAVVYRRRAGLAGFHETRVHALAGVTIGVAAGECVGIVGESGSGKSTLGLAAVGLVAPNRGRILLDGQILPPRAGARSLKSRRDLQIVLQNPHDCLDPTMTVAAIVGEGLDIHRIGPRVGRRDLVARALQEVGIDAGLMERRPHELSGGQRQRVAIARALAVGPRVLVLDEPTSALDPSVQAQILNLLLGIQQTHGIACLLISHDIDVVRHLCERVYVMRSGRVVEEGPTSAVLATPREPYTRQLIEAAPRMPSFVARRA